MHLERLTLILEIVGQKGEANVAEICAHSDLPKPTAYRLVQDLREAGLLDPVAKGRYTVGNRLRRITEPEQSDQVLLAAISPVLQASADQTGAAFFLSRLRGNTVEIIDVRTPDTGVSFLHPGLGKRPLHACSCAKVIAAFSPAVAQTMAGRLKAYTDFTITNHGDLRAELERIRTRGYGECVEEIERGMCSVAAPLGTRGRPPTMAIGSVGSLRVFTPTFRQNVGKDLVGMATHLTDRLGWADRELSEASA